MPAPCKLSMTSKFRLVGPTQPAPRVYLDAPLAAECPLVFWGENAQIETTSPIPNADTEATCRQVRGHTAHTLPHTHTRIPRCFCVGVVLRREAYTWVTLTRDSPRRNASFLCEPKQSGFCFHTTCTTLSAVSTRAAALQARMRACAQ